MKRECRNDLSCVPVSLHPRVMEDPPEDRVGFDGCLEGGWLGHFICHKCQDTDPKCSTLCYISWPKENR